MEPKLIEALLRGAELRINGDDNPHPVDFIVSSDSATLVFLADWWQKGAELGHGIEVISALPEQDDDGNWTFEHENGYVLAGPTDADVADHLSQMRLRTDLHRPQYLDALQSVLESESDFDFNPWLEAVLARPEIDAASEAEGETSEREVGKILLRNGDEAVLDALVIDDLGNAACADPDGFLASFAEQWSSFEEDDRPPVLDYMRWLSQQSVYGDRDLAHAGTMSASGDVQDIALQLVAG